MSVTVVVATYNRADLLSGTLAALASQEVSYGAKWEILVVDNNSQDQTKLVAESFARTTAVPLRYVFEPQQGLSVARNRGVEEAGGSVIAFTDDDVLPPPDWVESVLKAFAKWDADGVGGRILPLWQTLPPRWIMRDRHLLSRLALMDCDESRVLTLPLGEQPQVWGANMAFRRELFSEIGMFDPGRGMKGKKLARGEEVDLIRRALERGSRIVYDPSIRVFHRIGRDRLRRRYFFKIEFDDAENETRYLPAPAGRALFGAPYWTYRKAFTGFWRCLGYSILRRPNAMSYQLEWGSSLGRLSGYWRARRTRATG